MLAGLFLLGIYKEPTLSTCSPGSTSLVFVGTVCGAGAMDTQEISNDGVSTLNLVGLFLVGASCGARNGHARTTRTRTPTSLSVWHRSPMGMSASALIAAMVSIQSAAFCTREDKATTDTLGVGTRSSVSELAVLFQRTPCVFITSASSAVVHSIALLALMWQGRCCQLVSQMCTICGAKCLNCPHQVCDCSCG